MAQEFILTSLGGQAFLLADIVQISWALVFIFLVPALIVAFVLFVGQNMLEKDANVPKKQLHCKTSYHLREKGYSSEKYEPVLIGDDKDFSSLRRLEMLVCVNTAPEYDAEDWSKKEMPQFFSSEIFRAVRDLNPKQLGSYDVDDFRSIHSKSGKLSE